MRQVLKTIRGIVFLSNATNATLANPKVQLLGHARSAAASQTQTVLIADMGKEHHVAPLLMRWRPVLPDTQPAIRNTHQVAQKAACQTAAIVGNILKLHGF